MKKKISMLLCLVAAASFTLTSCNTAHEHTFSDKWASDATNHWHAATCEHGEEKDGLAKHADANEDGKCDVCDYEVGHKHTYATTWSKDATHHWKAATCTHTGEVSEKALHADLDSNYECDECDAHVHIINAVGYCEGCNTQVKPMDESDLAMVVAKVGTMYNSVVSGEVNYSFVSKIHSEQDSSGNYGSSQTSTNVKYTLGNGATEVKRTTTNTTYSTASQGSSAMVERSYSDTTNLWIYTDTEDTENPYKAIQEYIYDGEVEISTVDASEDSLYGYYYAVSSLADAHGAENILAALYEASQADSASAFVKEHNAETNTYKFSFTSLIVNATEMSDDSIVYNASLFETQVEFTYNDNYVLTSLKIRTDSYSTDAGARSEDDISLTYDPATKTATKIAGKQPNVYSFNVTQVAGERTYTHTKTVDSFAPSSFTFSIDGETVANGATLNFDEEDLSYTDSYGTTYENTLTIDVACPEGTYFSLAKGDDLLNPNFKCSLTNGAMAQVYYDDNTIELYGLEGGEYEMSITYKGSVIWKITIKVNAAAQEGPTASTTPPTTGNYITVMTTEFEAYVDVATLTAEKAGDYTFILPAGYGAWDKADYDAWGPSPDVDGESNTTGDSFTVTLAAGETYQFYLWAPKPMNVNHYISYTFVEDTTGGDEGDTSTVKDANGLGGTYNFTFVQKYTLVFTPNNEGATVGTLTVTDLNYSQYSGTYIYTIVDGEYTFTSENVIISKSIDGQSWQFQNPGIMMPQTFAEVTTSGSGSVSSTPLIIGNNSISQADVTYAYTAETDGTLTLSIGTAIMGTCTVTYSVNGASAVTLVENVAATLELSAGDEVVITVVASGYATLKADWTTDSTQGGDSGTTTEPDGSEENPFVIEDGESLQIAAQYTMPIFVKVKAGVTANLDCAAKFYTDHTDPSSAVGTSVSPTVDTVYAIYSDTPAGVTGMITTGTASSGTEGDGSAEDPFVIESFPSTVTADEDSTNKTYYTFILDEDGILTITYPNSNDWWEFYNDDRTESESGYEDGTFTVEVHAGETYTLGLGVWYAESAPLDVALSFTAQELAKDGDFSKPLSVSTYNENSISYAGGEETYVWYSYYPFIDGTLTLTFNKAVNVKYGTVQTALTGTVSNQTTVEIEIVSYEKIYIAIQTADYAEATITFSAAAVEALGTSGNPIVLNDFATTHTCEFPGGAAEVWYSFTATESGYVTLSSTFATAKLQGGENMYSLETNDSTTYGSVRFYANAEETTYVVIGDWAEGNAANIPFTLSFVAGEHEPDGSNDYPYVIESLPYTGNCTFKGGYSYVWYQVTVSETGYLTVTSTSDVAKLVISPVTNAYHDNAKTGTESVEYGTNAGVVYVGIMASDYAAAEIDFNVSFEAGVLEADGSSALPFTAVAGENTCAFPGGMNPVWYAITTTEACTITVSSSYVSNTHNSSYHPTSECAWLVIAPEADTYASGAVTNSNNVGGDVSIEATANTTYYIAVADWCEAAGNIVFNVAITPAA